MEKVNVHVSDSTGVLEIRQGEALPLKAPQRVMVKGLITAPLEYLSKRMPEQKCTHLIVDEAKGELTLKVGDRDPYGDEIVGALKLHPDFEKLGINTGQERDTFELADFIKLHRYFFSDKNVALKLVSDLKNFKAKVDKQIEQSSNDRGNTRLLQSQAVDSNIPEAFDVVVPIFKGYPAQPLRVEINIDARSFACRLISPDANDLIHEVRAKAIGEQVDKMRKLMPELAVLEV